MENSNPTYIVADNNTLINIKKIHWVKKHKECMYVCTKSNGCSKISAHEICKKNNIDNYLKLNKYYE
jgi:hypothetical protein